MTEERHFPEEEYQFTDIEPGEPFAAETKPKPTPVVPSQDVRTRVFIAIGVIVALLILYKVVGLFFTGKKVPEQPAVVQPVLPPPTQVVPEPAVPRSVSDTLTQLQQQTTDQANALKTIQTQVNDLQATLSQLNTSLTAINTRLDAMQKQIEELKKPAPIVVKPTRPHRIVIKKRVIHPTFYFVKAVIPGRAWLKSENGATITVSRGSFIQGYGRITRIDPQLGKVMTSSGRVIHYSPEDR